MQGSLACSDHIYVVALPFVRGFHSIADKPESRNSLKKKLKVGLMLPVDYEGARDVFLEYINQEGSS